MRKSSSSSLTRSLWRAQRLVVRALLLAVLLVVLTPPSFPLALQPPDIGSGAFLAERSHAYLVDNMDFEWVVWTLEWKLAEPSEGNYDWFGLDRLLTDAENLGLEVVLRVTSAPDWARTGPEAAPPDDMNDLGDFMYTLASHAQGKVAGYVIWNEPNLPIYWGGDPSPAQYVYMLSVVYPRIKEGDANAAVVTAGMATTGGAGGAACGVGASMAAEEIGLYTQQLYAAGAMNDLDFICGIYSQGGKGYFDVLGSHPYGFAYEPERDPSSVNGLAFRRVEQQRAVMESEEDGDKEIWALESGWILDPGLSCRTWGDWPTRTWQIVSEHTQADYLVRAFRYAGGHWPWMGMMSLFNMDFAAMYWYDYCHPVRWYSISYRENHLDPGNSPIVYREGYYALRIMQMDLDPRTYLPLVVGNHS